MTERPRAGGAPRTLTDEERDLRLDDPHVLAWAGEHLTQLRRSVDEQRTLRWSLGIGFVVGLAAHVGGYLLRLSATTEPLGLVADLLYGLGYALWTGVVVVVFFQVIPEAKTRQVKRAVDAFEAALRDQARAGSDREPGDDGAPTAS
ncbi:MAG TPA: hypothetical protein VGM21_21045 [Actinomycetota bacterium]|jgi:hypothetical protein